MKKDTKHKILTVVYFPFQAIIHLLLSPIIIIEFAFARSSAIAFDDVYMTADNPVVNPDGPTMQMKKKHCWLMRFVNPCVV